MELGPRREAPGVRLIKVKPTIQALQQAETIPFYFKGFVSRIYSACYILNVRQ